MCILFSPNHILLKKQKQKPKNAEFHLFLYTFPIIHFLRMTAYNVEHKVPEEALGKALRGQSFLGHGLPGWKPSQR